MTLHVPWLLDGVPTGAQPARQAFASLLNAAGGTVGATGLEVKQKGTPDMHVIIQGGTPEEGALWIPGTVVPHSQGMYFCWNDSNYELAIPASDATNPRIETIVARLLDADFEGTEREWKFEPVKGAAEAGATLENLKGVGTLPKSSYILAYVLVPAKATSIVTADIKDEGSPYRTNAGGGASISWGNLQGETGAINGGSGDFTVSKVGTGEYHITWNAPRQSGEHYSCVAGSGAFGTTTLMYPFSASQARIECFNPKGEHVAGPNQLSFIVIG
jgi:hypothetical protein